MMFGFITKARHEREMAAKDVHIHQLDRTAEAFRRDRDALKAEVDRLTPVRGDRGRFAGKAAPMGIGSPPTLSPGDAA